MSSTKNWKDQTLRDVITHVLKLNRGLIPKSLFQKKALDQKIGDFTSLYRYYDLEKESLGYPSAKEWLQNEKLWEKLNKILVNYKKDMLKSYDGWKAVKLSELVHFFETNGVKNMEKTKLLDTLNNITGFIDAKTSEDEFEGDGWYTNAYMQRSLGSFYDEWEAQEPETRSKLLSFDDDDENIFTVFDEEDNEITEVEIRDFLLNLFEYAKKNEGPKTTSLQSNQLSRFCSKCSKLKKA